MTDETNNKSRFLEIAMEVGKLVAEKNTSYGSAFSKSGEILRILYPEGIAPSQMNNALAITRILDKLFRIASGFDGAFGESAWRDILGYAILGAERTEREKKADEKKMQLILEETDQELQAKKRRESPSETKEVLEV